MSAQTAHLCPLPAPALSLQYLLYLPPEYESTDEKYPLVIFLHGSGERGTDLSLVAKHGWPRYANEGTEYPFILVSPQLPDGCHWCGQINTLNGFLDHLLATLRVDPKRVYITGLSDGGTGGLGLGHEQRLPLCRHDPRLRRGHPLGQLRDGPHPRLGLPR